MSGFYHIKMDSDTKKYIASAIKKESKQEEKKEEPAPIPPLVPAAPEEKEPEFIDTTINEIYKAIKDIDRDKKRKNQRK